jgi:phenylalanyl-tRNA synthetase beta chain
VKGGLRGLVVGEVLEAVRHPNADRLTVTKVNLGNSQVSQIVCGAPNVATGQKVVVAVPGTTIFPVTGEPFEIRKSKIRGEVSDGMICAEDEVGLGSSHEGIMVLRTDAVPGDSAVKYFSVESDFTISIGLTPNRPDAASHFGVARDVRAVWNTRTHASGSPMMEIQWPDVSGFSAPAVEPVVTVTIESDACTRYSGVHISGIKVSPSPDWLQNRLRAVGLKPINNIVDITNYVLYELGQPLHAFDASKIAGRKVIVKPLPAGTVFRTLDGIDRKLVGNELMICDQEEGMCIAGVFGGIHSGVTEATTEVFLESACFDAVSIRKTSKHHGLKTDASFRFERGSDPDMTITALKRAALLITEIAGGTVTSSVVDVYPLPVKPWPVNFSIARFSALTGISIETDLLKRILGWLDIKVVSEAGDLLQLEVPPYRVDVMREADVAEEILRIYGYDRIPLPPAMNISLPNRTKAPLEKIRSVMAVQLVANGFHEVMANSLYRSSLYENKEGLAVIRNPLSHELDIMRPGMLHPMLDLAAYNHNRKRTDLRFFEFGKTYFKHHEGYDEVNHLSILLTGSRHAPHWNKKPEGYDFFFLKSVLENVLGVCGINTGKMKWYETENPELDTALLWCSGKREVVRTGRVNAKSLRAHDITGPVWFADINLDVVERLLTGTQHPISEPPKFPEVRRDLSMLLEKSIQYAQIESLAFETERKILREVNLFDVFEGEKIGAGKKSYAVSFVLRDDEKTLTDKEIDKVMERLMEGFEKKLGAVIRKN